MAIPNPKWQTGVQERYDAFAEAYVINGQNGTKAAKKAGYDKNSARQQACDLLTIPYINERIVEIRAEIKAKAIKNKEQRQQFWTRMMDSDTATNGDKLRASELLGKSEADFTENIITTTEQQRELNEREAAEAKRIANILNLQELREGA